MRKKMFMFAMTVMMTVAMSMNGFAAGWQRDENGWWYGTNGDNTAWHSNGWQWVDGNNDGTAECYYFDENGYVLTDTITPDGCPVNGDGAWVDENHAVKRQSVPVSQTETTENQSGGYIGENGVHHNAGYDPAHPLKNVAEKWNLKLTPDKNLGNYKYINDNPNIHAMLTGQMEYYTPITGEGVNKEEYYALEQALYQWFCDWLNGMDFENMSEMERAEEVRKLLADKKYEQAGADSQGTNGINSTYYVLFYGKGNCADFYHLVIDTSLALGLTCGMLPVVGNHAAYFVIIDGNIYTGSNQQFDLGYARPDVVLMNPDGTADHVLDRFEIGVLPLNDTRAK